MNKFIVEGYVIKTFSVTIEADDKEDACYKAHVAGIDKLIADTPEDEARSSIEEIVAYKIDDEEEYDED